jgi:hypothetical protein
MNETLEFIANRIVGVCQQAGAQVDLEVLQWPGGSFIALLLLIRAMTTAVVTSRKLSHVWNLLRSANGLRPSHLYGP